jgi:predicted RNA-binding protein Jag
MLRQAPRLTNIAEILTANRGQIEIGDVTVELGFGRSKAGGLPPVIITIQDAPEGHPMEKMIGNDDRRPVFVKQTDLSRTDQVGPDADELYQLSGELRLWVRDQLQQAGVEINKILAPKPAKPDAPKLSKVTDLMHNWGTFTTADGVTFYASNLGFGSQPKTMVVRVTEAPQGHPMEVVMEKRAYAFLNQLQYESDDSKVAEITEQGKLAKELRAYLRTMLHDAGYTFKVRQPVESKPDHEDGPGADAEQANERAMRMAVHAPNPVAGTAPADLVAHAAMVDAELLTGSTKA